MAAERLGVEKALSFRQGRLRHQVWLDELWFAAPKQRDNTLDIESFSKQEHLLALSDSKSLS